MQKEDALNTTILTIHSTSFHGFNIAYFYIPEQCEIGCSLLWMPVQWYVIITNSHIPKKLCYNKSSLKMEIKENVCGCHTLRQDSTVRIRTRIWDGCLRRFLSSPNVQKSSWTHPATHTMGSRDSLSMVRIWADPQYHQMPRVRMGDVWFPFT